MDNPDHQVLLQQIDRLKHERIELVNQVEAEEEYITNVLQKRLEQLQREKVDLEAALESEQEFMVNRLQKEMDALRASVSANRNGNGNDNDDDDNVVGAMMMERESVLEALKLQMERQRVRFSEREQDLQRQIAALQSENHHLLQENVRLSQRLRRHGGSTSGDEQQQFGEHMAHSHSNSQSPPRLPHTHPSGAGEDQQHHAGSKSGSISDLRRHSLSDSEGPVVGRSSTIYLC